MIAMIVVAGEALMDLVVSPSGDMTAEVGGAPLNVARACARLGGSVALAAGVSTDDFGRRIAETLAADAVGLTLLPRTALPSTLAVAHLDEGGAASYCFYHQGTSAPAMDPVDVPEPLDAFITGGLALVFEPMATSIATTLESVVARPGARDSGPLVMIDVNCRPGVIPDRGAYVDRVRAMLVHADVVKVSDEDLAYLDGRAGGSAGSRAAVEQLVAAGVPLVLVTSGGSATLVVTATGTATVPVEHVPVVDTIGAGDCFTAAFVTWWLASGYGRAALGHADRVAPAVHAAHVAAAVVVGRRGADPARTRDLPPDWWPTPTR
ncbi:carbohydrate kinase [soil metagenome]